MKFSVIIPIYNVEKYLDECVQSVLAQTYDDFEVILVDDGSPDNCPEMCDNYADKDKRVTVIHKQNGGLSDARNAGLALATGEYVIFIDSDDWWDDRNALQLLANQLRAAPDADIIFFRRKIHIGDRCFCQSDIDTSSINGKTKRNVLTYFISQGDFIISVCTKLIRRKLITEHNMRFEKGLLSEDLNFSLELYIHAQNLYAINAPFYIYRRRTGSITTSIKRKNITDLLYIINKWRVIIPELDILDEEKNIYMEYLCYNYAIVLGLLSRVDRTTRKEFKPHLRDMSYLLKYDVSYKTHRVAMLYKLFGFDIMCFVLQLYMKYRPKSLV